MKIYEGKRLVEVIQRTDWVGSEKPTIIRKLVAKAKRNGVGSNQYQTKAKTVRKATRFYQPEKPRWKKTLAHLIIFIVIFSTFMVLVKTATKALTNSGPVQQPVSLVIEAKAVAPAEEMATPAPTQKPEGSWKGFTEAVDKVAPMYNFPKQVVLAQGALESSRGKSRFARERFNFLGIGAYDNNPNQAFEFENEEQCVIEYMRLVKKNFPEAWAQRDNPERLIELLTQNPRGKKYATDPVYVHKVRAMPEWKK